jgi:hypothetical protein
VAGPRLNQGTEPTKYGLRLPDSPRPPSDGCPYKTPSNDTCPASAGFSFWSWRRGNGPKFAALRALAIALLESLNLAPLPRGFLFPPLALPGRRPNLLCDPCSECAHRLECVPGVLRRHRLDHGDGQSQGRALDHEGCHPRLLTIFRPAVFKLVKPSNERLGSVWWHDHGSVSVCDT